MMYLTFFATEGFVVFGATMDLRPGGSYHFGLRAPGGDEMWGKFVYREISPPHRLVWVHSFSDAAGNVVKHAMSQDWPLLMLATVTFVEQAAGTLLTIRFAALDASETERDVFAANHDSMQQGWTGTLDQLVRYLSGRGID